MSDKKLLNHLASAHLELQNRNGEPCDSLDVGCFKCQRTILLSYLSQEIDHLTWSIAASKKKKAKQLEI